MRGGIPAINFDEAANFAMQKIAYLDTVIESGDNWFNNLKKNKGFSWGDVPDVNFIDEVYVKAWSFRSKVQSLFKKDEGETDRTAVESKDVPETVGDSLFSGVDSSTERN